MTDAELQYFYVGFYNALRRYRSTSLLGWTIVLLGCLSIPFGWNVGRQLGVVEVSLTGLTILAGLALVWQNISALEQYLRVPFPTATDSADASPVIGEIKDLMKEVDNGGWQEAYAAIGRLSEIQAKYGLPKLE